MAKKAATGKADVAAGAVVATTEAKIQAPAFTAPQVPTIANVGQYMTVAGMLKDVKEYRDRVEAFFAPHKKRAYDAWKGLCAEETTALGPALEVEKKIKTELARYDTEQEQARQAEERRLADELRKRAEQERAEEVARLQEEAKRTGNADLVKEAQAVAETPIEEAVVKVERFVPRGGGLPTFVETWSGEVTDMKKFIKWVAKNPADTNLLQVNQTALNQKARGQRENFNVDGAKAVKSKGTRGGR